jgi:hypothetical protein
VFDTGKALGTPAVADVAYDANLASSSAGISSDSTGRNDDPHRVGQLLATEVIAVHQLLHARPDKDDTCEPAHRAQQQSTLRIDPRVEYRQQAAEDQFEIGVVARLWEIVVQNEKLHAGEAGEARAVS